MKHFKTHKSQEDYGDYIKRNLYNKDVRYPRIDLIRDPIHCNYLEEPECNFQNSDYLQLIAETGGNIIITIPKGISLHNAQQISYSKDKKRWKTIILSNSDLVIDIPMKENEVVFIKGVAACFSSFGEDTNWAYVSLNINGSCKMHAAGNIMSLLYNDDFADKLRIPYDNEYGQGHNFFEMFKNNTNLISADNLILPATTLTTYCYGSMFEGCSSLRAIPKLPATTLTAGCYDHMFKGCTSLVNPPILPATTLADNCYCGMFMGCKKLNSTPNLPVTTLTNYCYSYMFQGCIKLTAAPELPATTLADYCYQGMFAGCTSLTQSPELPATTLAQYCYYGMFNACTSLTQAPELPATTLALGCYENMFLACIKLTTASELPATTLAQSCYFGMFKECSKITTAPELPATTLVQNCYREMFSGCRNLNYIKMLATNISATDCLARWVRNVAASGTFIKDANTTIPTGTSGIPSGWTVQTASE